MNVLMKFASRREAADFLREMQDRFQFDGNAHAVWNHVCEDEVDPCDRMHTSTHDCCEGCDEEGHW